MNRTASWLTLLVALIGTLVWARLERRAQERPKPASVAATPTEAEPTPTLLAIPAQDPAGASEPEHERSANAKEKTRTEAVTEAPSPKRRLPVRVLTLVSHAQDAEPVPGLTFQVFAQRPGRGLRHVPGDRVLFEGRTGADGKASFELDTTGMEGSEGGPPHLCARVVEPGFQQVTAAGRSKRGGVELRLPSYKGATARGRVVDGEGRGVEAEVRLCATRIQNGVAFSIGLAATMLADGWFELHFDEPVRDAYLLAEAGLLGTGTLRDLAFDLEDPPTELRIEVSGEGVLTGVVRDGSGVPAPGVDLLVQLAPLDLEAPVRPDTVRLEREGGGFHARYLETDSNGGFEVRGLRREAYVVRARIGQRQSDYSELLTSRPVPADGQPLDLTLRRPHLLVRLQGADGEPLGLSKSAHDENSEGQLSVLPRVGVFPCTPGGTEPLATGDAMVGQRVWKGLVFEVPDGARYLVGAFGGGFGGAVQVVEVPEGADRVEVELRAFEPGPLGSVALRVVNAGRELGPGDELAIRLETLVERVPLVVLPARLPPTPWVLSAPPGSYRVVVEGQPGRNSWHGTFMSPRAFGRVEEEVELRAGLTQELTLELDDGARLEVTLSGTPDEADRAAMRRGDAWNPPQDPEDESLRPVLATLTLEQSGRRPEPLTFTRSAGPTAVSGTDLHSRWPLNATQRSEVCPAGRYTLVARLPGGREARREVELVAGTTVAVRLEF